MNAKVRQAIYSVIAAIGALLVALGVVDQGVVDQGLSIVSGALLLVSNVLAAINARDPEQPGQPPVLEGADRSGQAPGE